MAKWPPGFPLTRRELAILTAAGFFTSCKKEEGAEPDFSATDTVVADNAPPAPADVPVSDVHVHLFNANFLPLDGVFAKWVDPIYARAVARFLTAKVNDCTDDGELAALAGTDPLQEIEGLSENPDALLERLYEGSDAALEQREVEEGLSSVAPEAGEQATEDTVQRKAAFKEMFHRTAEGANEMFPEKGGFFQWVTLMTWCEKKIWAALRAAYPDVQLFVAHMMDMENWYAPTRPPRYSWPNAQLTRMAALMKEAEGRMLTFFAFDPRRDDWQEHLEAALENGCAGVKFYPPNGFAPADEQGVMQPTTKAFFQFCSTEQLPIFTHSTPHGFEAVTGNGRRFANPKLWAPVLREFPELRVCFAHAGGEQGWFPSERSERSETEKAFSAEAIALCREYPNVYCEVAYLSPILKPAGQAAFQRALETAIGERGRYPFEKKIMYGSDWHMIHKLRDHRSYLPSFQKALSGSQWDTLRADFFLGNSIRWLNLPRYLQRLQAKAPGFFGAAAVQHLQSLIAAAG